MNYYNYIVLIIVVAILLITIWRGFSVGVIRVAVSVAALIATVFVARMFAGPVGAVIKENTDVYQQLEETIGSVVDNYTLDSLSSIKELPFPEYMLNSVSEDTISAGVDAVKAQIVSDVTRKIYNSVIYIALNIIVFIAIRICMSAFRIIEKLPIIKQANHLAGLLLGLAEGLLIIWFLAILLQSFAGESWAQEAFRQINGNVFLKLLYDFNPLVKIVG